MHDDTKILSYKSIYSLKSILLNLSKFFFFTTLISEKNSFRISFFSRRFSALFVSTSTTAVVYLFDVWLLTYQWFHHTPNTHNIPNCIDFSSFFCFIIAFFPPICSSLVFMCCFILLKNKCIFIYFSQTKAWCIAKMFSFHIFLEGIVCWNYILSF